MCTRREHTEHGADICSVIGVRAGPNSEQKIGRTRWIDSIRIRLKFGLIDVTYINTDSDADPEKYGVFTQFDGGKLNKAPYRYRANLIVDDI